MEYSFGQTVTLTARFSSASGLSDPDIITLSIKKPDGARLDYTYLGGPEIVREDAGIYHCKLIVDQAKTWRYRWVGEWGADEIAPGEQSFRVKPSAFD